MERLVPAPFAYVLLYVTLYGAFGVASPYWPKLFESKGLTPQQIGLILAAALLMRLAAGPLVVRLADLRKANDAAPRIRPYSNGFPAFRGFAALTVSASARDVVGARAAACTRAIRRTSQKALAHVYAAAAAAAATVSRRHRRVCPGLRQPRPL